MLETNLKTLRYIFYELHKINKISVGMAGTQPGCVGKFSVDVLILMFTIKFSELSFDSTIW